MHKRRFFLLACGFLTALVLCAALLYAFVSMQPKPRAQVHFSAQPPAFKPVIGDVHDPEDDDPDITVQQSLIPGFQFKVGGYTLSGMVIDARTGQTIYGAVVWMSLPAQMGKPTSPALHVVTDAQGNYQFQHIAVGSYTLVASRYYNVGDGRYYAEHVFPGVALGGNRSHLSLALTAIPTPDKRALAAGRAKNLLVIDVRGFYASSLLDDPQLVEQTRNLRAFIQRAEVLRSLWWPYGWRPLDQYALLTGSYPAWATYDPWPRLVPWGTPDTIDTTYWFTGGRAAHLFGQESIFDVAKGYAMQTGVVAGSDFVLSDATTRNLDLLQRSSSFSAPDWLGQIEDAIQVGQQNRNGFLLYSELAPLPAGSDASSSPDAAGDDYQQALLQADSTFGILLNWLQQQGLLANTLIALTTSQAQANHTDADNFYGMGSTGQGTSKQTLLAMLGPGSCPGRTDATDYSGFTVAPMLMQALGLPAPAESRMTAPISTGGCA